MASFTDQTNIPFSPYIETNPVDAYLRVGMYKEQQLQEGIQKVQQTVDTLTGLPIIKEEDKAYLQNKLGELKGSITKNLSGDFSDSRIVNQIAGAAKTIYSDPIVQNSVQGTMAYQKGLADAEVDRKAGKNNLANETIFNDQVQAWLTDGTVGSKSSQYFTGYTPYTDVNEMFLKYWKDTNPGEDISNAYYIDAQGNRKINPVIFKGKSAAQVQSVWNLVKGNANAQQQLQINGKFQYRGQTPQQLYQQLGQHTKETIDHNNSIILSLQAKAAVGDTEAANDIATLQQMNVSTEKSFSSYAEALKTNPDAVKAALASEQTLNSLIGAYSYQTMEKSPLWETSFEQNKFDVQIREWEMNYALDKDKFAWQQYTDQLKLSMEAEKKKKESPDNAKIAPAAVNPTEAIKDENTARMAIVGAQDNYIQSVRELAANLALSTPNIGGKSVPPPYYKDLLTNKWEPNVGPGKGYETEAEANGVSSTLMSTAKDSYLNGTLTGVNGSLMETAETKYKNLQLKKQTVAEVESSFEKETKALLNSVKGVTNDPVLAQELSKAYMVEHKLTGWEAAESFLKTKYGEDWRRGVGIEIPLMAPSKSTPEFEERFKNLGTYQELSKRLKSNTQLTSYLNAKDRAYKERQSTEVGVEVTRPVIDAKSREDANTDFASIVSSVKALNPSSNKGEYNNFLDLLDKSKKGWEGNIYKTYVDPITGQGSLSILRGSDVVSVNVPASEILRKYPEQNTFSQFREKFQPAIDLNRGQYTGTDYTDAYKVNLGTTSPYVVKYHVLSTGNGSYRLKWWVANNPGAGKNVNNFLIPGEVMGEKYGLPQDMSEEQVMSTINQMQQKDWLDRTIMLDQKLKQAVK